MSQALIPRLIHFIFGLASDFGGKPFSFIHFMAIRSAHVCNPDYRIRFYCKYEPSGIYWEVAKRYVEVVHVEPPESIHGRQLHHVAHQADILRLQYLFEQGGVYLDLDTITPFDPLLQHQMVMGVQGRGNRIDGLCNAVMLAAPGSSFVRRWLDTYRSFRSRGVDQYWDEHSVRIPLTLAREYPSELTVLDRGAFFYPSAEKQGVLDLFVEDKTFPAAYCHHLWEGLAWKLVSRIDERNVRLVDTSYNRMARRFLCDRDEQMFRSLRAQELARLRQAPVRLNLGCGGNRRPGWLNVDLHATASPDLCFDARQPGWPLDDDTVVEAELSHVLEHVGSGFETVVRELYRVCRHGAAVHIKVPHPRHDWFLTDPKHDRPVLPETLAMLDAELSKTRLLRGDTASALAVYWGVDFETASVKLSPSPELAGLRRSKLLRSLSYPFFRQWAKRLLGRAPRGRAAAEAEHRSSTP